MFPGYIKSVDDALDYLADLALIVGGELVDGLSFQDEPDAVKVEPFTIGLSGGFRFNVAMNFAATLAADFYKFNLDRGGVLVWRHDNHPGHEAEHGGPTHLHVGPRQNVRSAHAPVTLLDVIALVHATLRGEFTGR